MQKIIYPTADGIAVIHPTGELPVEEVARKDVPAGVPYLIIGVDDIPEDRTFRAAWDADFSEPHGQGIGSDAWFAEQEAIKAAEAARLAAEAEAARLAAEAETEPVDTPEADE